MTTVFAFRLQWHHSSKLLLGHSVLNPNSKTNSISRRAALTSLAGFGIAVALTMFGCGRKQVETVDEFPARGLPNYQGLVSVGWVKAVLDYESGASANARPETFSGEQFVVVEASWSTLENASEYRRAHVPGAIHVNTDDFENGSPQWRLKDLAELQQVIGEMGIAPDTTVVVYGSQLIAAARVWWILKYAGVADVRLMDGNIQTWRDAGFPTEKTVNVLPAISFSDAGKTEWLANTESVAKAVQSRQRLLADVRSDAEYRGRKSGYDYLDAKGRIPGAIHLGDADDSSQTYRKNDGRFRSPVEVLAEWKELGLVPDPSGNRFEHDVIFYCGGGWRSSVAFFYAWLLGFENIQNYSDGWGGWSTQYQPSDDAKGNTPGWKQVPTGNPFESG
jgi:3-mercaptopyruvate sulfurtransferase SseA